MHSRAHPIIDRCRSICRNALLGLAFAATSAVTAQAQWPARNVTVVVPYAAGGNTDIMARMASQKLGEAFGQSFIVDNRVGAGGALAAGYVAQAAPDGYTLFFAAAPVIAVLPKIQKVNFDPQKDFIPVSVFGTGPFVLAIASKIPAHSIPEFVAYARANPGKISYASAGTGTLLHVAGELFKMLAGIEMVHVPYRGSAPALSDLLGGQVQMMYDNIPTSIEHIRAGELRTLGVTTAARSAALPDVPTISSALWCTSVPSEIGSIQTSAR